MSKKDEAAHCGTLSVSGIGEVQVKPDVVRITLGVSTQSKSAQEAVRANAEAMASVVARIKTLDVSSDDLQTSGPTVYPIIDYQEGPNKGQITGYSVENHLTVQAAVDLAGRIFDEGMAAGANQSSSMTFGLRDETAVREKALERAVKAAHREAKIVLGAAGGRLEGARTIEIVQNRGQVFVTRGEAKDVSTPVLPGVLTVSAQVQIVYDYCDA